MIPNRAEIPRRAMDLRIEEIRVSRMAAELDQSPDTLGEQLIMGHAHGALTSGHDRDFRGGSPLRLGGLEVWNNPCICEHLICGATVKCMRRRLMSFGMGPLGRGGL